MLADRLRSIADWLDKERTFHWPRRTPWRRWVMMRWAVKEHRRIHDETPDFIFSGESGFLSMRRLARSLERINTNLWATPPVTMSSSLTMGDTIEWRKLDHEM